MDKETDGIAFTPVNEEKSIYKLNDKAFCIGLRAFGNGLFSLTSAINTSKMETLTDKDVVEYFYLLQGILSMLRNYHDLIILMGKAEFAATYKMEEDTMLDTLDKRVLTVFSLDDKQPELPGTASEDNVIYLNQNEKPQVSSDDNPTTD